MILFRWDEWVQQDRLRPYSKELLTQQNTPKDIENGMPEEEEREGEEEELARSVKPEKTSSSRHAAKFAKTCPNESEAGSLTRKRRKRRSSPPENIATQEEDTQLVQTSLLKINLADELWELLQDDFVEISQNKKIFDLPLKPSISEILQIYLEANPESSEITEFVEGIERCFNKALGLILLYRFERQQYSDLYYEQSSGTTEGITSESLVPSKHYGFVHLLRLLTKVSDILPVAKYSEEKIAFTSKLFDDFVSFLNRNCSVFFSRRQYVSAPPQYRALAKLV